MMGISLETTAWFPPEVKPVRVGWYACRRCNLDYWWDGKLWRNGEDYGYSLKQDIEWRGLAQKP